MCLARREVAGGGESAEEDGWRRLSGGEGLGWPSLGAARERCGARDGVCAGGAVVEERGDG